MNTQLLDYLTEEEIEQLSHCCLCPHNCNINRLTSGKGFCATGLTLGVGLIINHKGEEPVLGKEKGVCNVFFSHCNCQCIFCQNYKISSKKYPVKNLYSSMEEVVEKIILTLEISQNILGFVTPTHQIPVMKAIIRQLNKKGYFPKIIYNSSGYENVSTLQDLEETVDVYLPDMKYGYEELGRKYSMVKNYPQTAIKAIKEMYRQKGSSILTDKDDNIESGLIIRHLILPQETDNSIKVLDDICWEISPNVTLSLMSQYNPPYEMKYSNLNGKITSEQYNYILEKAVNMGFSKIYTQDISSVNNVLPDFDRNTFIRNN